MYPWIRDAAAAAAAAVSFAGSHHHPHHHHHHQINSGMVQGPGGISINGNIKGENGFPSLHNNNSANDCMLAIDYAHNKKSPGSVSAYIWTTNTAEGGQGVIVTKSSNSPLHSLAFSSSSPPFAVSDLRHRFPHQTSASTPLGALVKVASTAVPNSSPLLSKISNANSASNNDLICANGTTTKVIPSCGNTHEDEKDCSPSSTTSQSERASATAGVVVETPSSGIGAEPPCNKTSNRDCNSGSNNPSNLSRSDSEDQGSHNGEASAAAGNAQLMQWMSAVMAEHINHQTAVDGVHYVWNGEAVEGKLNSPESHHHNSLKSVDPTSPTLPNLYGAPRSNTSGSSLSSSPPSSAGIVVPQPLSSGAGITTATKSQGGGGSGRKYQCKMCPQVFTSKADLQLHTQIHMREAKPYKCSQCTKAFANSSYLSQHTRIHLGIKPYRCEICQRKFTQLSHLQQHIRTHTGDKPYKCRHPGCNKAFSQLSNLQSHSRCHQTDKPYKCNSCYKCFTDEASLLDHIPKHKESKHLKTHICNFCGKSYTQETYLTKHMQKHVEKTEKRMARQNNNNNNSNSNNNNHHQTNGTSNNTNGQSHQVNNHQSSNSGNVLPSPEMYWKSDIGESSPPSMCLPSNGQGNILGRQGSEGPDDLRVNNISQHHPTQPPTPTNPYDALANALASTKAGASAFTPIQTVVLNNSAMLQIPSNMGGPPGARAYLPYEPLSFPKAHHHQMSAMDMKAPGNAFPNQLISLHQIRNYAHQPAMTPEHLLGLKDK